jgi:methionyl-tRNA formyltransferase
MRIVFMGSPEYAIPSLEMLSRTREIAGIVTQPDRPAGRGRSLRPSAVKSWGLSNNVPIIEPKRVKSPDVIDQIETWKPDAIVVAAYGQILSKSLLDLPPHGCLNIHASLLPRWRGAAPVHAAILHGDSVTGVTIMCMDEGLDTGPILSQRELEILPNETGGELSTRLSQLGADLLNETLPDYFLGNLQPTIQDDTQATYAPMLKKTDGALDFNKSAERLSRQVLAYEPWPGTFFFWNDRRIVVRNARALPWDNEPGFVSVTPDGFPAIHTSDGALKLDLVQPAGKDVMSGDAYLRGAKKMLGANLISS